MGVSTHLCEYVILQRAEEPKLNWLLEPETELRIEAWAPARAWAPFYLRNWKKFYRKKSWLLKKFL